MLNNNRGFLALDTIVAVSILAVFITAAFSVMLAAPRMYQENRDMQESLRLVENHLDELYGADWGILQEQSLSEHVMCRYEKTVTDYGTEQLKVLVFIDDREYTFLIERSAL